MNFIIHIVLQLVFLGLLVECMNLPFMFGRIKGGRCPRGDRMGDPDSMEVCDRMCEHDYDCYGDNQLCCPTECGQGYVCVEKYEKRFIGVKPGNCPRQIAKLPEIMSLSEGGPVSVCSSDYNCAGSGKCCPTTLGKSCMDPLFTSDLQPNCPDFHRLEILPCDIPNTKMCKNNRDCGFGGQICCRYRCGGICIEA